MKFCDEKKLIKMIHIVVGFVCDIAQKGLCEKCSSTPWRVAIPLSTSLIYLQIASLQHAQKEQITLQ